MMTITRNKKKSMLSSLVKKCQELKNQKAEVGYFEDSGEHTLAGMNYASLMFLHENPYNDISKFPKRPVFEQIKPIAGEAKNRVYFKKLLEDYFRLGSNYKVEDVLQSVGRRWSQKAKYVFGNAALLTVTQNPTPLYDTGELSDNFGYKTSINYTLRYM